MGGTVEHIKIVEKDLRRGCRIKNSPTLWQGFMHLQWNRCHIFTNKRGTYGIIADDVRFATQLSNVYGNAIRHARCQKLFLFSLSVTKHKCAFSAVQVLYQIYKLNLSFYSKKTPTSKVGDELRLLPT